MRDGKIVQSGKYSELLESGTDFRMLASMNTLDSATTMQEDKPARHNSMNLKQQQSKVENGEMDAPETRKGTSKLIEDERRETGIVTWHVYKLYSTKALGWWGVVLVVGLSLVWQASLISSDYWLAFQTSKDIFKPRLFIKVYAMIAAASIVLVCCRAFFNAFIGLKTAQIFFSQFYGTIFHAPMSFFDTTPSGRILSRVSPDCV